MKFIILLIIFSLSSSQKENESMTSGYFSFNEKYSRSGLLGNFTLRAIEINGTRYIINKGEEFKNIKVSPVVQFNNNEYFLINSSALSHLMNILLIKNYDCNFIILDKLMCKSEAFNNFKKPFSFIVDDINITVPFENLFFLSRDKKNYISKFVGNVSHLGINSFGYDFIDLFDYYSINYLFGNFNVSSKVIRFSKAKNFNDYNPSTYQKISIALIISDILLLTGIAFNLYINLIIFKQYN